MEKYETTDREIGLLFVNEKEIRAVAQSFGELMRAVRENRGRRYGGRFNWLSRSILRAEIEPLETNAKETFGRHSLYRFVHNLKDEPYGGRLAIEGDREIELLHQGAELLLKRELDCFAFKNEPFSDGDTPFACTEEEYDQNHIYGAGFFSVARNLVEITSVDEQAEST